MNSDSMSVGGSKHSMATTFNAMQGTQRNYWKYAAIPTGSLLVISLVAIGVLLAFYNPWTAAAALAAAGGYPILAIPAAFAVIGLVGFVISSTGWILRYCHKKAIQEEAYAVSPTSDTESEETDEGADGTDSSSSSSTDASSSSESSESDKEGEVTSLKQLVKKTNQQVEDLEAQLENLMGVYDDVRKMLGSEEEDSIRKCKDLTDAQAKESESSSSTSSPSSSRHMDKMLKHINFDRLEKF